ncbi:MAG: carbon-nitrogen hydrolase family protein [Candidatus Latescibacteria bacterium]|nr:carbon-nitrogen hydrolase family protein [Candidatus Latescibacterota bacterium]
MKPSKCCPTIKTFQLTLLISIIIAHVFFFSGEIYAQQNTLPREVWVATVTLTAEFESPKDTIGDAVEDRINRMLKRMEEVVPYNPDIICLSEVFAHTGIRNLPAFPERAEEVPGPIVKKFAAFARAHNCYVICPIYTRKGNIVYNSAVLIDRKGKVVGQYDKINPTEGEIDSGISPGPVDPPVFKTDFGTIGMQICFDANWPENWRKLKEAGAEIVFWPSAFAGGSMLNTLAANNSYYIVACTRHEPARIVDVTGVDICSTGRLQSWVCTPLNLDKKVFHWDFQDKKFKAVQKKYGRKVGYSICHPEGWFTLESRSPDVSVESIMKEFDLITYDRYIHRADEYQKQHRP